MKLYHYLKENRSQSITTEKFNDLLNKNCSDILTIYKNNDQYIYRGLSSDFSYIFVNPTNSIRKSKNLEYDFYNIMFDEVLPSWKNIPNRRKSIISTTDKRDAAKYGTIYIVYPYDNSKIGITKADDIWYAFNKIPAKPLKTFNIMIFDIANRNNITINNDKESLLKIFDVIDNLNNITDETYEPDTISYLNDFFSSKYKKFIDYCDDIFDPNKNQIKQYNPKNFKTFNYNNSEIWIEGECLMEKLYK